jgi:hypothetical protein
VAVGGSTVRLCYFNGDRGVTESHNEVTAMDNQKSNKIQLPDKSQLPTQNERTKAVSSRRLIFTNGDT